MAWYSAWTRAQRLVITVPSGTVTTLSYFPVVLAAASLPGELTNNTYGRSDGGDLAFAADLGIGNSVSSIGSQLPCEVVSAAFGGSPSAEIHVQVPSVAATGSLTYAWVLYGNPGQTAQPAANSTYGSQAVWKENGTQNFQGVWHLNSTTIYDSTGLNPNGTNTGTPTVVSGACGNGLSYTSSQYSATPTITGLNGVSAAGIAVWAKRATSSDLFAVTVNDAGSSQQNVFAILGYGTKIYNYAYNGIKDYYTQYSSNTTIWTMYHVFFNGSTELGYVNGIAQTAGPTGSCPLTLGSLSGLCYINNLGYYSPGNSSYDEVRYSAVVRSSSWVAAEYANQSAPGAFIAVPSGQGPLPLINVFCSGAVTIAGLILSGSSSFSAAPASGAVTLASVIAAGTGSAATSGTGSVALAALATAGVGAYRVPAAGSVALGALTAAGMGAYRAPATGSAALAALTAAGSSMFTAPATGSVAMAALTAAGLSKLATTATGSAALAALTAAGMGMFGAPGVGSAALADLTLAGSGSATGAGGATGTGSVALAALTTAGLGAYTAPATGSAALAALTTAGTGNYISPGNSNAYGVVMLAALTTAGSGVFTAPATGSIALAALATAGVGAYTAPATGSAALAALTAAGMAMFATTATGSAALAALTAAGSSMFTAPATGSVALAALTAAGSGGLATTATGSAALAALTAAGLGVLATTATGSVALAALTAAGLVVFTAPATGSAALAALTAAGSSGYATTAIGSAALPELATAGVIAVDLTPLIFRREFTSVLITIGLTPTD